MPLTHGMGTHDLGTHDRSSFRGDNVPWQAAVPPACEHVVSLKCGRWPLEVGCLACGGAHPCRGDIGGLMGTMDVLLDTAL